MPWLRRAPHEFAIESSGGGRGDAPPAVCWGVGVRANDRARRTPKGLGRLSRQVFESDGRVVRKAIEAGGGEYQGWVPSCGANATLTERADHREQVDRKGAGGWLSHYGATVGAVRPTKAGAPNKKKIRGGWLAHEG